MTAVPRSYGGVQKGCHLRTFTLELPVFYHHEPHLPAPAVSTCPLHSKRVDPSDRIPQSREPDTPPASAQEADISVRRGEETDPRSGAGDRAGAEASAHDRQLRDVPAVGSQCLWRVSESAPVPNLLVGNLANGGLHRRHGLLPDQRPDGPSIPCDPHPVVRLRLGAVQLAQAQPILEPP